ncbi:SpoIIE family protein phosphatase [Streptomyces koelreuteriae]|uniref:SpoIIE family protein phosphatase n=1 Tax=Streptomyces koelreuteriae TaxID=2838015 RepID=UPI002109E7B0|nr:SpoIIE family protein phosphatase [Streptomyces koelreuteriae]UUA04481.1 SpoIIE family protein phosphatase [Streptomyces koelreuteriae]
MRRVKSGRGERDITGIGVDETLMSALFAAVGAGVYAVDDQGRVFACNPWAEQLLGYEPGTLIGVDAHRALHPPGAGAAAVPTQRPTSKDGAPGRRTSGDRAVFLRADGTSLQVWWTAAPLPAALGHGEGAVVVFHDATAEREREGRRAERYAHSETMREQAEYDLAEATWLGELTLAMTSTLDTDEALHRLVRQLVPRLADTALIDLAEGHGYRRAAHAHHIADILPAASSDQGETLPRHPAHHAAVSRVMQGGGPQHLTDLAPAAPEETDLMAVVQAEEAFVIPLRLRATTFGALTLTRAPAGPPFNVADRALAEEVARRISLGLDNTRLHAAQADIATALQRALLTALPDVPGIELAAHYQPAQHTAEVGGDWYDAFLLHDGDLALVIGDVTGHDIQAASRMSELRNMLRALAVDRPEETPGQILRRLDTAQARLTLADSATAILARLRRTTSGAWQASWSVAGHPPPLLITADGVGYLTGARAMLLGLRPTAERPTTHTELPADATLLLYTDALVESRAQSLDEGMTRLRQHVTTHRHLPLPELCAKLARDLGDPRDDITLIAARTPPLAPRRHGA